MLIFVFSILLFLLFLYYYLLFFFFLQFSNYHFFLQYYYFSVYSAILGCFSQHTYPHIRIFSPIIFLDFLRCFLLPFSVMDLKQNYDMPCATSQWQKANITHAGTFVNGPACKHSLLNVSYLRQSRQTLSSLGQTQCSLKFRGSKMEICYSRTFIIFGNSLFFPPSELSFTWGRSLFF